ncbi:hypothetical protein BKG56_20015 [Mycobacteroides chelonae]|nr:hypothetical protein BKG56_20015 [Mycobacteroides chelonae]
MHSGSPKNLRMTPQIKLVVEGIRRRSDPTSVPVTDREVCWQVAVDGFADSFTGHTSSAERTSQILLERGGVASQATQTRLEDVHWLTADSGQPVGPRASVTRFSDVAPQCVHSDAVGVGQPCGI